jgi:UDP-GlcNAc:undecaprenyl-phosphate GlcNAc-1-phosphate transferase
VALMLYGMCGIAATFSLVQSVVHHSYAGVVIVLFCAAAWMGIQHLGYVEFDLAGRLIRRGTFRKVLDAQVRLHVLEKEIEAAGTVDECWQVIRESCPGLGFSCVRLHLRSWKFSDGWDESARKRTWTVRVPLSGEESIEFGRAYDEPGQPEPVVVGSLAKVLRQTLAPKLTVLQAAASNTRHNPKHSIEADPSADARAVIVITK